MSSVTLPNIKPPGQHHQLQYSARNSCEKKKHQALHAASTATSGTIIEVINPVTTFSLKNASNLNTASALFCLFRKTNYRLSKVMISNE